MPRPNFQAKTDEIAEIIRVNHAGEYGAKVIYQGQLGVGFKHSPAIQKKIEHMMHQEQEHLDYFSRELKERHIPPTLFLPIWHAAGFVMGAVSALFGFKPAMLVTEAVEEVIVKHYQEQIEHLEEEGEESSLLSSIKQFQADEEEHKSEAIASGSGEVLLHSVTTSIIKKICQGAIFISKRI